MSLLCHFACCVDHHLALNNWSLFQNSYILISCDATMCWEQQPSMHLFYTPTLSLAHEHILQHLATFLKFVSPLKANVHATHWLNVVTLVNLFPCVHTCDSDDEYMPATNHVWWRAKIVPSRLRAGGEAVQLMNYIHAGQHHTVTRDYLSPIY